MDDVEEKDVESEPTDAEIAADDSVAVAGEDAV